jgi:hypothetical protein
LICFEEEESFNHYKNDLERHAHTSSGVAGAEEEEEEERLFNRKISRGKRTRCRVEEEEEEEKGLHPQLEGGGRGGGESLIKDLKT